MKYLIITISILIPSLLFSQNEAYKRVEEMPRFPGCESMEGTVAEMTKCSNQKLIEYIYNNVQYPKAAQKAGTEGTVVIQFIVDKNGVISDEIIARDIGGNCGEEALRVVKSMAVNDIKWRPGIEKGVPVKVLWTLPVKFKLEGKKSEGIDTGNQ